MTPAILERLTYRLLGILALIFAVRLLPDLLAIPAVKATTSNDVSLNVPLLVLAYAIPLAILVAGGLVLIFKGGDLSRVAVNRDEDGRGLTAADVHSILFSTVGVLLVGISVVSLPYILHNVAVLTSEVERGIPRESYSVSTRTWTWIAGESLQAGIGVLLIIRGSRFATLLRRRFDRSRIASVDSRCPHCGFWIDATDYRTGAKAYLCGNCKQELPRDLVVSASN